MRRKVVLLIPLTLNSGNPIPQELLNEIYGELFAFCGGLTVVGKVQGAFRMGDGSKQEDLLEQVWVAVEESEIPILKKMVSQFGTRLGQEKMYFEITDSHVEFLPFFEEGEDQS